MVGDEIAEGEIASLRTRCGRTIDHPVVTAGPARYDLVARNGNRFYCTTQDDLATCIKCMNLITTGTRYAKSIYAKSRDTIPDPQVGRDATSHRTSRPANAQKRAVASASAAPARTARPHARPVP
jgi:hypothetical protein